MECLLEPSLIQFLIQQACGGAQMCISNKLPDTGAAAAATGSGPHPENHHPKGRSMKLVLMAISYS